MFSPCLVDDNVVTANEGDLFSLFEEVKGMLSGFDSSNHGQCSELLQHFHRNIEHGDVTNWEGASISQVCLAQGSPVFVKLEEIATISKHTAGAVFQDVLLCSEQIWEKSGKLRGEPNVFQSGGLRVPNGYNTGYLDEYGQLINGNTYPFSYNYPSKLHESFLFFECFQLIV